MCSEGLHMLKMTESMCHLKALALHTPDRESLSQEEFDGIMSLSALSVLEASIDSTVDVSTMLSAAERRRHRGTSLNVQLIIRCKTDHSGTASNDTGKNYNLYKNSKSMKQLQQLRSLPPNTLTYFYYDIKSGKMIGRIFFTDYSSFPFKGHVL